MVVRDLCNEVVKKFGRKFRVGIDGVLEIQEALEGFLIDLFASKSGPSTGKTRWTVLNNLVSNMACLHAKRITLQTRDMHLVKNICSIMFSDIGHERLVHDLAAGAEGRTSQGPRRLKDL